MLRTVFTTVALCAVALAQKPASPTFEAASVKPAAPQEMGRVVSGMQGGPGTRDPTQVTFTNSTLKTVLTVAYDVKGFFVTGPPFLDTEHFDIIAKLAPGTSREDFRLMLQNLLAERFKVVLHKESKEAPSYALVVAKGGPKIKEAEDTGPVASDAAHPNRGLRLIPGPKGLRVQAVHAPMGLLSGILSGQVGRPVEDMTGLKGLYDYTLDFSPEGVSGMPGMMGAGPLGGKEGAEAGPDGGTVNIFTAIQDLGLKLESRKSLQDLIIVDSAEKTPTGN